MICDLHKHQAVLPLAWILVAAIRHLRIIESSMCIDHVVRCTRRGPVYVCYFLSIVIRFQSRKRLPIIGCFVDNIIQPLGRRASYGYFSHQKKSSVVPRNENCCSYVKSTVQAIPQINPFLDRPIQRTVTDVSQA
jgi:hypothetical protein